MLVRLIYASRAEASVDASQVTAILESSRRNNAAAHISGVLCFNSHLFVQQLEGEHLSVNRLYARIMGDARHRDCCILGYTPVSRRSFGEWSMGYMGEGRLNRDLLFRYSAGGEFDPYTLSPDAARDLILELSAASAKLTD